MSQLSLSLFFLLTALVPSFQLAWTTTNRNAVAIRAVGAEPEVNECLEGGREVKIRFEARLCRRRQSWFDACSTERTEHHEVSYDAITESYRVVSDRHGDEAEPVAVEVPVKSEAVRLALTVESLPLDFLIRDDSLLDSSQVYLQTRSVTVCKGGLNRTVANLSQILTLGLVNVVESDSGWVDFAVDPSSVSARKGITQER